MGFRCNPLSIQTCPPNSSFADQSPLITKCIYLKTTTKASTLRQNTARYEKIELQYSILLIIFTESLHLSEALHLKPCLLWAMLPSTFHERWIFRWHIIVSPHWPALCGSRSHHPSVKSEMGCDTQSWRVALTPGGREGETLHSNSGEEGARGTDALLFRGKEERHINHPKTSVLSAALEFCQSAPVFPPIAAQKNGKNERGGGKSPKLSSVCPGQRKWNVRSKSMIFASH